MNIEQQRALAIATARLRIGATATPSAPTISSDQRAANIAANADRQKQIDALADPSAKPSMIGQAAGVAGSLGAGLARGVVGLAGLPGTVSDMLDMGVTAGLKATGAVGQDFQMKPSALSGAALQGYLSGATGGASDYRDPSVAGQFASTIGEFVGGGGGLKYGVTSGLLSEAAGQATKGTDAEPWARFIGALVAPSAETAYGAAKAGVRSLAGLPRGAADPERLKLAKVLDQFNIPITAGQRVGADGLRKAEGATGAGVELNEKQAIAFTKAALKTAGTSAERATRDVLDATAKRIGDDFEAALSGVEIAPDIGAVTALTAAADTYKSLAPRATASPLIDSVRREAVKAFRAGSSIPAQTVATWRSGLSKLTASADTATREAASQALEALDDATSGALVSAGRVDDVAKLAKARGQWRNYLAIQRAATMAGEDAALGIISPARLASSVTQQGRAAVATGRRGDIGALADAGVAVMSPLPTVLAGGVRSIPGVTQITGGATGGALGSMFGPLGSAAGAVAGMAMPGLLQAAQMTGPVQRALVKAGMQSGDAIVSRGFAPAATAATVNATGADANPYEGLFMRYGSGR